MKTEEKRQTASQVEEALQSLVEDYLTQKQTSLLQMKKGLLGKSDFITEAKGHLQNYYGLPVGICEEVIKRFEQYIFGYSRLSPLIDDPEISDIRMTFRVRKPLNSI